MAKNNFRNEKFSDFLRSWTSLTYVNTNLKFRRWLPYWNTSWSFQSHWTKIPLLSGPRLTKNNRKWWNDFLLLKFKSLRDISILDALFIKFFYMTPSMVWLLKKLITCTRRILFQALMVFKVMEQRRIYVYFTALLLKWMLLY